MKYNHLIITRFNIRIDDERDFELSSEWMDYRFRLFECYCLPSVMAQSVKRFRWLLLMDESTPQVYLKRMERYALNYPQIEIVKVSPIIDFSKFYRQLVKPYTSGVDLLVTSRLDSDDMLAYDYVECIQQKIGEEFECPYVISFSHGIQFFLASHVALRMEWLANHFTSLVERIDCDCRSVLGYSHISIGNDTRMVDLKTERPMWGEIVHEKNVINNFTPHVRTYAARYAVLPFPGEWKSYLCTIRNSYYKANYYVRYLLRGIINRCVRIFRIA